MPGVSVGEGAPWGIIVLIGAVVAQRLYRSRRPGARGAAIAFYVVLGLLGAGIVAMFAYWAARGG